MRPLATRKLTLTEHLRMHMAPECQEAAALIDELRLALDRIANFRPSETDERPPHTQIAIYACQTARAALAKARRAA